MGSKYPIVWLNFTYGIKGFFNGDYNYNRIDLKINYSHHFKYLGESKLVINAGLIYGQIPISNLYSGVGSFSRFTIYAPASFGTMSANEFYSDRYISFFFSHNFKNLLTDFGKFKPEPVFITNIVFGAMNNIGNHHNINLKTLENGYYESGIVIRKLLNLQIYDIGVGVLYRYGPYGFDTPSKNFAYKISLYYSF